MGFITKELNITLCSDLCTSSGFSYAGIIDSDVAFDGNGVPYISGRRLKGCFRETARLLPMISVDTEEELFGISDSDGVHGVIIGNAVPVGYDSEKWSAIKQSETLKDYLNEENTLKLYTSVRGQTRIDENGVAKKDSLRFTRVINQYNAKGEKQVFRALITYDEAWEKALALVVEGTRNIGLNRNHGLGSVRMCLGNRVSSTVKVKIIDHASDTGTTYCRIRYAVRNIEPMILSAEKNTDTTNYISGSTVLGALAARYLAKDGCSSQDEFFKDVFLKQGARFSDLTIAADKRDKNNVCVPLQAAPLYINRLKKTKKIVDMSALVNTCKDANSPYYPLNGNQPKKLSNHFVLLDSGKVKEIKEVGQEIIYHHSKNGRNKKNTEGVLYFMNVITSGQVFAGDIVVKATYKKELLSLVTEGEWYLGKSRSAQYGKCELFGDILVENWQEKEKTEISGDDQIIVTFISDGIFMDEMGNQSSDAKQIENLIIDTLRKNGIPVCASDEIYLQLKVVQGFQAKWNRRKNDVIAVAAGSAFIMKAEAGLDEYPKYIGERNMEGFGRIMITKRSDAKYMVDVEEADKKEVSEEIFAYPYMREAYCEILLKRISVSVRQRAYEDITNGTRKLEISSSSLGRLTLMLKEAIGESNTAYGSIMSLYERIESIKTEEKRKEIKNFIHYWFDSEHMGEEDTFMRNTVNKLEKNIEKDETLKEIELLKEQLTESEAIQRVFEELPKQLLEILTLVKYRSDKN